MSAAGGADWSVGSGPRRWPAAGLAVVTVVSPAAAWVLGRRAGQAERVRLNGLARRDPLTGVGNRAGLQTAAGPVFAAGGRVGGLLVDLDRFKAVNDTYGHAVGDLVLVAAAGRLARIAAGWHGTAAARLGGDEFVLLLPGLPLDSPAAGEVTTEVGARLVAGLGEPYEVDDVRLVVGCSVGAATVPAADGLPALLAAADMAMYAAKRAGGGLAGVPATEAPTDPAGLVPAPRRPVGRLRDRPAADRRPAGDKACGVRR